MYSLFSALIMHVYQMRSANPQVVVETRERMGKCMHALQAVSRVWIVAKMVYTLFESILGNKALEDRLHKSATRRRHRRANHPNGTNGNMDPVQAQEPPKRKFDQMDLGPMPSGPVPNVSYVRSRPQTPAPTPGLGSDGVPMAAPGPTTPGQQMRDSFMSGMHSRGTTRPPTPFNPSLSVPATPPEIFLVTAPDTHISQSLWENFQPNQLFPDDSGLSYFSPPLAGTDALDPQLQQSVSGMAMDDGSQTMHPGMMHHDGKQWSADGYDSMQGQDMGGGGMPTGSSPDDTWSNSSNGGIVPATLNVEDWFVFLNAVTEGTRIATRRLTMVILAGLIFLD